MAKKGDVDVKGLAIILGRAVLKLEHKHFLSGDIDNPEHVPRIHRVAAAISTALQGEGLTKQWIMPESNALHEHGKALFMEEWNKYVRDGDDPQQFMKEGLSEYGSLSKGQR